MGERSGSEVGQQGQERRVELSGGVSEGRDLNLRIDQQVRAHRELELCQVRDELRREERPDVQDRVNQDRVREQTWREGNEARPWWHPRRWLHKLFDI
jgi:hypothetical protein